MKTKLFVKKQEQGAVLLEAMIAIVLFAMGILALTGLQATMIKSNSDNKYRSDASFLAQQSIGRMWADPSNLADFAGVSNVSSFLPNGTRTIVVAPRGLVTVTIDWQQPGNPAHSYQASTYIGTTFND
ncbi:MAG: prepilin-type cleavage/methylation domain-containing protein [Methylotenera sp.]|nr:prepilin-type cleavage/methylation domain-containing protein [Methylotenera sp.]